ncbi:MAG: esterase-like activity of phytase family protein [Cytophagales bacterium]
MMKSKLRLTQLVVVAASLLEYSASAQVKLLNDYSNKKSATIGTFQGITFREAGFSGLYAIPHTGGKEFWTVSDRGVNIDAANANKTALQFNSAGCIPTYDKIFAFPTYAPKIHRIRISGDSVQILRTITLKRPDGTTATGLINPTGFGSTATEVISTDTVTNCANFSSKTAGKDIWGIDSEGIVVDKDGNFWISEENGPTIWKVSPSGIVLKRYTPFADVVGAQSQDVKIDSVFKYKKNNRGFESIAITPNGKIYAIIQSPLLYPSKSVGEATMVHRVLEIDPATNQTKMFAYLNEGVVGEATDIRLRDWKVSDLSAINDTTFLVLEAAARGTKDIKKLYKINISNATVITGGQVYGGKSAEALKDSAGLAANSIIPVKKTLVMNLLENGWPATLEKAEGIAIINDSTIAISNDNDYAQTTLNGAEDGVAVATSVTSHVLVFGLSGTSKLNNFVAPLTNNASISTASTPYVSPVASGVEAKAILTVGEEAPNGYKMVGLPDGLGAYDNGNGTFTLLMNHEIRATSGIVRAHGGKGAFVSKWVINKSDLSVVSGSDLIKTVKLWDASTSTYKTYGPSDTTKLKNLDRFCSADLPEVSAYYNSVTGAGTQDRIFMNGEESNSESRAFAHVATGSEAGVTYELPRLGKGAWENAVAHPATGDATLVGMCNDGSTTDSKLYFYLGTKTKTGSVVEKAGLTNGKLYAVKIEGYAQERSSGTVSNGVPAAGAKFTLIDLGNVENQTGAVTNTQANTLGATKFSRVEDAAWNPSNMKEFYFNTTDQIDQVADGVGTQIGRSKLWRLTFDDLSDPTKGGVAEAVLDGTEGHNMLDNLTIDAYGHVLLNEDVGNNAHNGKVWQYSIATDSLKLLAKHDVSRFGDIGVAATAPFNQDEETSGIIDMEQILGKGYFLLVDQAHNATTTELVEGGQLLMLFNPDTYLATKKDVLTAVDVKEENTLFNSVSLFPNPTDANATLTLNVINAGKYNISITNSRGELVQNSTEYNFSAGTNHVNLNTSEYKSGIYFVQISNGVYTNRIKAVVIH